MKMPSHVLRLMCHWLCYYSWLHQAAHKLNACKYWSINPLLIGPYTVSARAHVHKSVWEKHRKKNKHKLAKHSGLPSDMKSVQGSKILADVRTDSFHSGPLTDQIIVDRFQYRARVIRTAGRDLGREFICQHKSPAKPDLGRQHTYTPSTCHSEDADSPVLHVLFSSLLFTFALWTWGGVDGCGHATNLYKTRSGFSKVAHLVSFCRV